MSIIKRIKWPGWMALALLVILVGVYHFFKTEDEVVYRQQVEVKNFPTTIVHSEEGKKYNDLNLEVEQEIRELDPSGKYIALTFDDGPNDHSTLRVLETLEKYDAKATFFMLGIQVESYPEIARRIADEGHEIASHSNSHKDMTKLDTEGVQFEFDAPAEKIKEATGITPTLFRPPYGAYNETVYNYAENNNYSIILWSVDSLDWQSKNANSIEKVLNDRTVDRSIVLMHDIHDATAEALPKVMATLSERGYEFVTVSELLSLQEKSGIGPHYGNVL